MTRKFRHSAVGLVRFVPAVVSLWATLAAQTLVVTRMLSGSGTDAPTAIATDSSGNVYIAGTTTSPDFPLSHALIAQLPEPALRISADGHAFTGIDLPLIAVYCMAASSDGMMVLASTNDGLYRSGDGGATWTRFADFVPVLAIAIDPTDSTVAYAVRGSGGRGSIWSILKSTDAGATWQNADGFLIPAVTAVDSRIIIDPIHPSSVYAMIAGILQHSADAGATWKSMLVASPKSTGGFTYPKAFAIAPSRPNIAYATTSFNELLKTTDGGATWQSEASTDSGGPNAVAVDPRDPSTVWIVGSRGIEKSTDAGATLQVVAHPGDGSWESIAVSPANSDHVYAADRHNVYATFDGGATWSIVAAGQIAAVLPTQSMVLVGASVSPTIFLARLDPSLSQILYSTWIGVGTVSRIAVDASGNVFLTGTTQSHAFPTTPGAAGRDFQSSSAAFVTKLRADGGAIVYSALFDGLQSNGIAVDPAGEAVIAGAATGGVPVTPNAFEPTAPAPCLRAPQAFVSPQTGNHGFVIKLTPDGTRLVYGTYLTGACGDSISDVAADSSGGVWVAGATYAPDFPVTPDALAGSFPTQLYAGFVSHLGPSGDKLLYSSFIGSGYDYGVSSLALAGSGSVILAGSGTVTPTPGAYRHPGGGCPPVIPNFGLSLNSDDGFVMKFQPGASSPAFIADIGGGCQDSIGRMGVDSTGNIWVTGFTLSSDFATVVPLPGLGSQSVAVAGFLAAVDPSGTELVSASISQSPGIVAAGPSGITYFTEPFYASDKPGSAVFIGAIDANQRPPIALDQIHFYSPQQLSGAFYTGFAIAPGQLVRVAGRGIGPSVPADARGAPGNISTSIAGVQVTFNGIAAQLVSVQANEIVCFAPYALNLAASATVQVNYNGQQSNPYSIQILPQNIDVVAIVNQDGSVNSPSNPAAVNSVATIYITGAGQTDPPSADGSIYTTPQVAPRSVPLISVNGVGEKPVFFGAAVGQPAGIMQVNLFVPDPGASTNDAVYIGGAFLRIYAKPQQ